MSSLLICNTIDVSQDTMNRLQSSGSMIGPIDANSTDPAYKQLAEILKTAEDNKRKLNSLTKVLAIASFVVGVSGLAISWARYKKS